MTKSRRFSANKIALYLTVLLMISALCTDGVRACDAVFAVKVRCEENVLGYPGAGEFFTGSLLLQEQQSVRELSADWQMIQGIRLNRSDSFKTGFGGNGADVMQSVGPIGIYGAGQSFGTESAMAGMRSRDVIVCYIHNQDGQKG